MKNINQGDSNKKPYGFLRLPEVLEILAVSRSTFHRWIAEGKAPKPIKIGMRMSRWESADIIALMQRLASAESESSENKS